MARLVCYGCAGEMRKKLFYFFMVGILLSFRNGCFAHAVNIGGGYVMALSPGHLRWMAYTKEEAAHAGIELDICILEYGSFLCIWLKGTAQRLTDSALIPTHPYPKQMDQAILALKHLLTIGYMPSDVWITSKFHWYHSPVNPALDNNWRRLRRRTFVSVPSLPPAPSAPELPRHR